MVAVTRSPDGEADVEAWRDEQKGPAANAALDLSVKAESGQTIAEPGSDAKVSILCCPRLRQSSLSAQP